MFTKLHDNTIETKFIQNLVNNTNIPTHDILKDGNFVVENNSYLTQFGIYKCNRTGDADLSDTSMFTKISDYEFGREYFNFTTRYCSTDTFYDSMTHYYLGEYLRAYRDVFDIDLMPFYNCYNGEYLVNVDFDDDNIYTRKATGYKIVAIPVHFNKTYSVCIDSDTEITLRCAIYGEKGTIQKWSNILYGKDETDTVFTDVSYNNDTTTHIKHSQFRKPFAFTTPSWNVSGALADHKLLLSQLAPYQRYLKLLIKIPQSNNSSIVVIEKDLTKNPYKIGVDGNYTPTFNNKFGRIESLGELSLTQISDGKQYVISNRLIEFLMKNVIDSQDDISGNIKRVQEYTTNSNVEKYNSIPDTRNEGNEISRYRENYTNGVWNESMRDYIFNLTLYTNMLTQRYDITGFVDKDAEQIITRGQE